MGGVRQGDTDREDGRLERKDGAGAKALEWEQLGGSEVWRGPVPGAGQWAVGRTGFLHLRAHGCSTTLLKLSNPQKVKD